MVAAHVLSLLLLSAALPHGSLAKAPRAKKAHPTAAPAATPAAAPAPALEALPPVASTEGDLAGRIIALKGDATLTRPSQTTAPISRGDLLHAGDAIKTADNASLRLLLQDDSVIDVAANTSMKLDAFAFKAKERSRMARITMFIGRLWARVSPNLGDEQNFHVTTPNAVAGVRGTSLVVDVDKGGQTNVTVVNGAVQVRDARGATQMLGALQQSSITRSGQSVSPVTPQMIGNIRSSVAVRSALVGNATGRLTAYTTARAAQASNTPPPEAPPAKGVTTTPRDSTASTTPPLDIDPSKNFARLKIQVHIKGGNP